MQQIARRNLRQRTRTLKRDGGRACLDSRSKLNAIRFADGDNWDCYPCCNISLLCIDSRHLHWSSSFVIENDDCNCASELRIHRLLDKRATTTLDQHNIAIGVCVRQLGRAVQRLCEDNLCISVNQMGLGSKVCLPRGQGAASPCDVYTYARMDRRARIDSITSIK